MFQVIHPPYKKGTLARIACLCFEIGVCPWLDLSALFQYTSPTPVVSLHLIPRIRYHPGIPVALLTGSSVLQQPLFHASFFQNRLKRTFLFRTRLVLHRNHPCVFTQDIHHRQEIFDSSVVSTEIFHVG